MVEINVNGYDIMNENLHLGVNPSLANLESGGLNRRVAMAAMTTIPKVVEHFIQNNAQ